MIKLYFAARTRAVRILWLLEELQLPYELIHTEFVPTKTEFFAQATPFGKIPTIEDGEVVICESGAIVEYILERYGDGRLAPAVGSPQRGEFLQWLHFSESTLYSPLGVVVWLVVYRGEAESQAELVEDARARAAMGFEFLENSLGDRTWVLGEMFSAADIMLGFTLAAARLMGVLDERYPRVNAYFARLAERPAFKKTAATE
jgi:glutathione S-transferase